MTANPIASADPAAGAVADAPLHVAIIMDGNGRWAAARGLKRADGHREGVAAARRTVEAARDLGVGVLTLYSFSTENWRRPAGEVRDLMNLLRQFIGQDLPTLKKEGVRVRIIGDRETLDAELRMLVSHAEKETGANARFTLQIAFNYGGRAWMTCVAGRAGCREGWGVVGFDPKKLEGAAFARLLDTGATREPDLVIRTSGEKRISNFLLWQAAYAEYVFLDVLWPDFDKAQLAAALDEFRRRERRFGGVGAA